MFTIGSGGDVLLAAVGLAAIVLAAFISALDTALSRMSLAYAEDLQEEGRRGATALLEAVEARKQSASPLVAARGVFQSVGYVSLAVLLVALFVPLGWPWWAVWLATLTSVALIQLVVVGAALRLLAGSRYVSLALLGAPLALRLQGISGRAPRSTTRTGVEAEPESRLLVADELRELADEAADGRPQDLLEDEDRKILRSVFALGQTRVGELMVPRAEMVTVKGTLSAQEALQVFVESGFSRIPVVGHSIDDVHGVLYLKDLTRRMLSPEGGETLARDLARAAAFVPEVKWADDELRVMQATNTHLALVVDEYGGIAGLVTMEDILEELVGELVDEHDRALLTPQEVEPGLWQVPTSMAVDDLGELLGTRIVEDEVYSAGGLLTKALDEVPVPGAEATIGGVHLRAGQSVGRRRRVLSVYASVAGADHPEEGAPSGGLASEGLAGENLASEELDHDG